MKVEIVREAKLSKIDHLFVVLAEGVEPEATAVSDIVAKAVNDAGFGGRSDETITLLTGTPRKLTLIGVGKKISVRCVRTALYAIGKIARKQRDRKIAVAVPLAIPDFDADFATRIIADALGAADYKYDSYITVRKDDKAPIPIDAVLIAPSSLDAKRIKALNSEARAIIEGVRTVRDLGNAPSNIMTATRIAERAAEVAKEIGVKCTIYGKREIERMKMGGLIAVNRGSTEEPRFIVLEYTPKKAKKHVALVGKGITFD